MLFGVFLAVAALVAGAIAAITGFGVGSLLTPAMALQTGTKLAVAAVAIPHFTGTAQRFWMLRRHVLLGFGIASADWRARWCIPVSRVTRWQACSGPCSSSPASLS
jgi:uncharacterized membrane protein YfcA